MGYTCSTCGDRVVPVEGVSTVEQRGYYWHAPCLTVDHCGMVAFPSEGKLVPETIMEEAGDG